jgi:hypothetical protein
MKAQGQLVWSVTLNRQDRIAYTTASLLAQPLTPALPHSITYTWRFRATRRTRAEALCVQLSRSAKPMLPSPTNGTLRRFRTARGTRALRSQTFATGHKRDFTPRHEAAYGEVDASIRD